MAFFWLIQRHIIVKLAAVQEEMIKLTLMGREMAKNGQKRPKTAKNGKKWSNKQILKIFCAFVYEYPNHFFIDSNLHLM